MRNQTKSVPIFSQISKSIWMKCSLLPQAVGVLKLMLNLLRTICIQRRELYSRDCVKYIFNTGLRGDTCEQICFRLGMMLDTTKLYRMIPV